MTNGILVNQAEAPEFGGQYSEWMFIMCENCYWSASISSARQTIDLSVCPFCKSQRPLALVPIARDEVFTFGYSKKHGVELDFMPRKAQ